MLRMRRANFAILRVVGGLSGVKFVEDATELISSPATCSVGAPGGGIS